MRSRPFFAVTAGLVLLAGLDGSANPAAPPGFLDAYTWSMDDPLLGGLSGIEIFPNGQDFIALSDRAAFTTGRILRDAEGRISAIEAQPMTRLKGKGDDLLKGPKADSEGLALAPDGSIYISFEGSARVLHYPRIGGSAENLPSHPDFRHMQPNASLESVAIGPDGTIYTLPERTGNAKAPFPVYRLRRGKWDKDLSIPRRDAFLPVEADVGPDGRFYVLERDFRGLSGFASRLRRFDFGDNALINEVTLIETPTGLHDNLEGLSVWRDANGRLTATMIADNNFNFFLRNQIVEYRLPD